MSKKRVGGLVMTQCILLHKAAAFLTPIATFSFRMLLLSFIAFSLFNCLNESVIHTKWYKDYTSVYTLWLSQTVCGPEPCCLPAGSDSLWYALFTQVISQLRILGRSVSAGCKFDREIWSNELSPILNLWKKLNQVSHGRIEIFKSFPCVLSPAPWSCVVLPDLQRHSHCAFPPQIRAVCIYWSYPNFTGVRIVNNFGLLPVHLKYLLYSGS